MRPNGICVGTLAVGCLVGCSRIDGVGPGSDAKWLMEQLWAARAFYWVRLGEVRVMTEVAASVRGEQIEIGVVHPNREATYENLWRSGVIRLDRDRDFSKAAFSWENFGKLSQDGIRRVFEARLLPAHTSLQQGGIFATQVARLNQLDDQAFTELKSGLYNARQL